LVLPFGYKEFSSGVFGSVSPLFFISSVGVRRSVKEMRIGMGIENQTDYAADDGSTTRRRYDCRPDCFIHNATVRQTTRPCNYILLTKLSQRINKKNAQNKA
jgi:hypothetical protein